MLWDRDFEPASEYWKNALYDAIVKAGYEFDAKKKELKKIEQKSAWSEEDEVMFRKTIITIDDVRMNADFPEYYKGISKWLESIKNRVQSQPKQEWSKEDIKVIKEIIFLLKHHNLNEALTTVHSIEYMIDWLKSLRPQKSTEWSEEDEKYISFIIKMVEHCSFSSIGGITKTAAVDWIKSLRLQNRWKPSEEQLEALESATENCAYSEYEDCLKKLIKQLKQL